MCIMGFGLDPGLTRHKLRTQLLRDGTLLDAGAPFGHMQESVQ